MTPRLVTGIGVASACGVGRRSFFDALRSAARPASEHGRAETFDATKYPRAADRVRIAEVRGFDAATYLGDKGLRSLDRLTKLLVVAARLGLHDARLKEDGAWTTKGALSDKPWSERVGIVVSNAYGSLEAITELHRVAVLEDARYINPSRFPLTVSNSAAGYASIWEELRAVNVTVSDGNCGGLDAVACADVLLDNRRADALLVGGAEAMSEALFLALYRLGGLGYSSSKQRRRAADLDSTAPTEEVLSEACIGEGAALVVMESADGARARGAEVLAEIVGYGTAFAPPDREASLVHATPEPVERAVAGALSDAGLQGHHIDVVVSGASGLRAFDDAELLAIQRSVGASVCVVAPKLALGETLGAGGAMGMLAAIAYLREGARGYVVRGALRGEVRTALVTSMGHYGNASAVVMRAA